MTTLEILSDDGTLIPVYWYGHAQATRALLILPALGIQAKFYRKLAQALFDRGVSVLLMEQRGHGLSNPAPSRRRDHSLADLIDTDIHSLVKWLKNKQGADKVFLVGHSLGGHISTIYADQHPDNVSGIVHLACAFPYFADYPPRQARLIKLIVRMIPILTALLGYYPGNRVGFGGREAKTMMRQWAHWAGKGNFDFDGMRVKDGVKSRFAGPVLSISFAKDDFSSDKAVQRALSLQSEESVSRVHMTGETMGEYLGHVNWARSPEPVAQTIMDWLPPADD